MKEKTKAILVLLAVVLIAALAETITVNAASIMQEEAWGTPVITEYYTEEEIDLLCRCVYAEAGNQGEIGQRLVAAVVLNRVEKEGFPDTITGVITSPNQFVWSSWSTLEVQNSVLKELQERTNSEVLYFRTGHYHNFGTPIMQHGAHFFSGE